MRLPTISLRTAATIATTLLAILVPILAVGETYSLVTLHKQQKSLRIEVRQNRALVVAQRQSRIEITYETCQDQNGRGSDVEHRAVKLGFKGSGLILIDTLVEGIAPHQDCSALVLKRFHVVYPPKPAVPKK